MRQSHAKEEISFSVLEIEATLRLPREAKLLPLTYTVGPRSPFVNVGLSTLQTRKVLEVKLKLSLVILRLSALHWFALEGGQTDKKTCSGYKDLLKL